MFFATPTFAITKSEHDAMVEEAASELRTAEQNLYNAQEELRTLEIEKSLIDNQLIEKELSLIIVQSILQEKQESLNYKTENVQIAQYNYDNNLIEIPGNSEVVPGIKADIYNGVIDSYPMMNTSYNYCKTITLTQILHNWGGGDIFGCGGDFILIRYTGYITVPATDNYWFLNIADDGWHFTLNNTVVNNNWWLKGCGGSWSSSIQLEAGISYPFEAWFYEHGGGACSTLYYQSSTNWGVVPAAWYSQTSVVPPIYVKDPALLEILNTAIQELEIAQQEYELVDSQANLLTEEYNAKILEQTLKQTDIEILQQSITSLQTAVVTAQIKLDNIPEYIEPEVVQPEPTEEPLPEPTPEPTPELPVEEPQSDEEIMAELLAEAQEDDLVVSEELAAIPVVGAVAEALVEALNFFGNAGADMTPEVREKAEKVVVAALVAGQVAQVATTASAGAAAAATRRIK